MRSLNGFLPLVTFLPTLAEEICYLPLDVMFLQDTTGSFEDDLPNVVRQIPAMVSAILESHPNSTFGVAEFKDKPYFPLGEADDFCYRLETGVLSEDLTTFNDAYAALYASGGGDLPEATFQALINTALDSRVGWRPIATSSRAGVGESGARLVILATDAVTHLPGDIAKYDPVQFPDLPQNLPPNSGGIVGGDLTYTCLHQDYPDADQMKAALTAQGIYLAILTPNDPDVVPGWQWVNEDFLGQPADFYQFIAYDSSDLLDGVLKAIEAVTAYACPTTTAAPATDAPPVATAPPATEAPPIATAPPATEAPPIATAPPVTEAPPIATAPPGETTPECPPCEHPCPDPCHCCPMVIVKVAERPSLLRIEYEK